MVKLKKYLFENIIFNNLKIFTIFIKSNKIKMEIINFFLKIKVSKTRRRNR